MYDTMQNFNCIAVIRITIPDMNFQYQSILDVAKEIEEEWRKFDNEITFFPQIALEKTKNLDLSELGNLENIPILLENPYIAAIQDPSPFSDFYFKIYDNGRFYIELLNWWGSDINIHDHDFSGVHFQLKGKSLNVKYQFSEDISYGQLSFGTLSVKSAEIWNAGNTTIILPGAFEAHNVNHLDVPTVSLLFKTYSNAAFGPQKNYFPPFLKAEYGVVDIRCRKKIAVLRLLSRKDPKIFHKTFKQVIKSQTNTENLFTMLKMVDILFQNQHVSLINDYASFGGEIENAITTAIAYYKAVYFLNNIRKQMDDLSNEEILAVSVLSSSYDANSLRLILRYLENQTPNFNFPATINLINDRLSTDLGKQFDNILNLYNISDLIKNPIYS